VWIAASIFVFNTVKGHTKDSVAYTLSGNILLLGSLMCDGITGSRQDRLAVNYNFNNLQMMYFINFVASLVVFPISAYIELSTFMPYVWRRKTVMFLILLFSCSCSFGQIFMYTAIKQIGALHTSIITVTRKFVMVILSVVLFGKHLEGLQWVCLASAFIAIAVRTYHAHNTDKVSSRREVLSV